MEEVNRKKAKSYALAHEMIEESISRKCPLQAIAIEESIISDRLWSALNAKSSAPAYKHETLGNALRVWSKENQPKAFGYEGLTFQTLTRWYDSRNKLLHGIVKSFRGEGPKLAAVKFRKSAMQAARDGLLLVRLVEKWSKRQVRRSKRVSTKDVL